MHGAGSPATGDEFTRLHRAESVQLLATAPVGRLIFTVNALPTVRPMNFALAGELIVLPTATGTTVARRVDGETVAFEADDLDAATSSGWSVTVIGRAALVADPRAIAWYQAVPLVPWAPGVRDQFVTISTELIEGRRVRRSVAPRNNQAPAPPASPGRRRRRGPSADTPMGLDAPTVL